MIINNNFDDDKREPQGRMLIRKKKIQHYIYMHYKNIHIEYAKVLKCNLFWFHSVFRSLSLNPVSFERENQRDSVNIHICLANMSTCRWAGIIKMCAFICENIEQTQNKQLYIHIHKPENTHERQRAKKKNSRIVTDWTRNIFVQ